jgi:hypothetical protein
MRCSRTPHSFKGTLGAIRENIGIQKRSKYNFPRHDTLDHPVISRDRKTGDPTN